MSWFKRAAGEKPEREAGGARPDLAVDLRLERLRRAVRDFPGRSEIDLARIIYGRDAPLLVADDARRLEAAGALIRDPESGRLYVSRS